jgi:NAD(P)-dependent dehydrogenase (short-subunit alcohol dehydrogenase family)
MSYYCLSEEIRKPYFPFDFQMIGEFMSTTPLRVLVTGASRGIGEAIATQLLDAGHSVALTARTAQDLEAIVAGRTNKTLIIPADVTDPKSANIALEKIVSAWGGIDVLILNAGDGTAAPVDKTTNEIWEHSIAINLTAPFQYLRAAVPAMKEAKFGRIIVIASSAGLIGEPNVSAYTAAKHGVIGLVRSTAAELAKYGITVNAVCPSYVDTPMTKRSLEAAAARTGKDFNEVKAALEAKQPSGRFLTPTEVASAALAFIDLPNLTGQAEILKGE